VPAAPLGYPTHVFDLTGRLAALERLENGLDPSLVGEMMTNDQHFAANQASPMARSGGKVRLMGYRPGPTQQIISTFHS
jgi:hypothetical protein